MVAPIRRPRARTLVRLTCAVASSLALAGCESIPTIGEAVDKVGSWFSFDPQKPTQPAQPAQAPQAGTAAQGEVVRQPQEPAGRSQVTGAWSTAAPQRVQTQQMAAVGSAPTGPTPMGPVPAPAVQAAPSPTGSASWAVLQDQLTQAAGDRLFFEAGSAQLTPRGQEVLVWQADWLRRNPMVSVTLAGHADDKGTPDQLLLLGQKRADAAKAFLTSLGINPRRVVTVSFGNRHPFALGKDAAAQALNRRVVMSVNPI